MVKLFNAKAQRRREKRKSLDLFLCVSASLRLIKDGFLW
jgi:hypothetical protein